jgi:hypothetical protein
MLNKLYIFVFLLALVQTQSCQTHKEDKVQEIFDVNKNVEFLYFFKQDVSISEKEVFSKKFDDKFLLIPTSEGYVPGNTVKAVFGIDKNGYEGFGIKFEPHAKKEQKEEVKKYIVESPLIFRVYENVVPDNIDDLPATTRQEVNINLKKPS